jgi:hypothetical protein
MMHKMYLICLCLRNVNKQKDKQNKLTKLFLGVTWMSAPSFRSIGFEMAEKTQVF